MPSSFLLRFQEPCVEGDNMPSIRCATQTETKTYTEQGDSDPGQKDYRALPISAGTQTKTGVEREGPDADRNSCSFRALPPGNRVVATTTQTVTRVQAEADDADPWDRRWQALPIRS